MGLTSADPANLAQYTHVGMTTGQSLGGVIEGLVQRRAAVAAACCFGHPDSNATQMAGQSQVRVDVNVAFVEAVRQALLAADGYGGTGVSRLRVRPSPDASHTGR